MLCGQALAFLPLIRTALDYILLIVEMLICVVVWLCELGTDRKQRNKIYV